MCDITNAWPDAEGEALTPEQVGDLLVDAAMEGEPQYRRVRGWSARPVPPVVIAPNWYVFMLETR